MDPDAVARVEQMVPGGGAVLEQVAACVAAARASSRATGPSAGHCGWFDDAASAAMTPLAIGVQTALNALLTGNSNSTHIGGTAAKRADDTAAHRLAQLLNAPNPSADSVIFTPGGTLANDFALSNLIPSTPKKLGGSRLRDILIVGQVEHPSVVHTPKLDLLKQAGYSVVHLPVHRKPQPGQPGVRPAAAAGSYSCDALRDIIATYGDRIALLSTQHGNSEIGALHDVKGMCSILKEACPSAVHHADCIQTFGKVEIDLQGNLPVDAVSISFHKVGGPKRAGALILINGRSAIVSRKVLKSTTDVSANVAGVFAAEQAVGRIPQSQREVNLLSAHFKSCLQKVCTAGGDHGGFVHSVVSPPEGEGVPGIVSVLFPGLQAAHFVTLLGESGIRVSSGSACSAQSSAPSHVLSAISIHNADYFSAVRFSFSPYLERSDVDHLVSSLQAILSRMKLMQDEQLGKRGRRGDNSKPLPEAMALAAPQGEGGYDQTHAAEGAPSPSSKKRRIGGDSQEGKQQQQTPTPPVSGTPRTEEEGAAAFVAEVEAVSGGGRPVVLREGELISFDAISLSLGELVLKGGKRKQYERHQTANIKQMLRSAAGGAQGWASGLSVVAPSGYPDAGFVLLMNLPQGASVPSNAQNPPKPKGKAGGGGGAPAVPPLPRPARRFSRAEYAALLPLLESISGIATITPVNLCEPSVDALERESYRTFFRSFVHHAVRRVRQGAGGAAAPAPPLTFGVKLRRTDKGFPVQTEKMQAILGSQCFLGAKSEGFRALLTGMQWGGPAAEEGLAQLVSGELAKGVSINLRDTEIYLEMRIRKDCIVCFDRADVSKGAGGLPDGVEKQAAPAKPAAAAKAGGSGGATAAAVAVGPVLGGGVSVRQESRGGGRPGKSKNRVLCLLSGGHDSPIAAYKVINRGCSVGYVHFDGYPYVPKEVTLKVRRIAQKLNGFQSADPGAIYVVPFSGIQEIIARTKGVSASFRTVLYRVYMFHISEALAMHHGYNALCTGDNLGQVASQTLSNMSVLNDLHKMLVIRPLMTYAKPDILELCEKIGVFELTKMYGTADCCTVFKPANPTVNISPAELQQAVQLLQDAGMDAAVATAVANVTTHIDRQGEIVLPDTAEAPVCLLEATATDQ